MDTLKTENGVDLKLAVEAELRYLESLPRADVRRAEKRLRRLLVGALSNGRPPSIFHSLLADMISQRLTLDNIDRCWPRIEREIRNAQA